MDIESLIDRAAEREKWLAFGHKLLNLCLEVQKSANVKITERGFYDPKILALALLARTYMNLSGVIALAQLGLVVEVRVLARCCYENLTYATRLFEKEDEFVSQMIDDDVKSTQSRLEFILNDIADLDPLEEAMANQLRTRLQELKEQRPTAKFINTKKVTLDSIMKPAYLFYSQLSGDSAHPSITALKRHAVKLGDTLFDLAVHPDEQGNEVADSVNIACNAVLGTCVAVNTILGVTQAGPLISALGAEYVELGGKQKSSSRPKG